MSSYGEVVYRPEPEWQHHCRPDLAVGQRNTKKGTTVECSCGRVWVWKGSEDARPVTSYWSRETWRERRRRMRGLAA